VSEPLVSIVVPTRNGAATLPALIDAIARQRVDFPFELVVVDSSSTDGSVGLLRDRADRFISIAPASFDHGATRNLAIANSRGELIVLIVQDAQPASDDWLTALTMPLRADSTLAGVCARQEARPDASRLTRRRLERWLAASSAPRIMALSGQPEFEALTPIERLARCAFDNVCSCIRRSVWAAHPFPPTPIAEDLEWAREVMLAGHRLAYVPSAVVIHSHERSLRYEFTRTRLLHRRLKELFGLETIPTWPRLIRSIASTLIAHLDCEASVRAAALAVVWPLGQYVGAKAATTAVSPPVERIA
jgi:glycosyltransferase involved in cell wall biosynthesis